MYGEATNPLPFIIAAYAIGFFGIFGYACSLINHRKRTLSYLAALAKAPREEGK